MTNARGATARLNPGAGLGIPTPSILGGLTLVP